MKILHKIMVLSLLAPGVFGAAEEAGGSAAALLPAGPAEASADADAASQHVHWAPDVSSQEGPYSKEKREAEEKAAADRAALEARLAAFRALPPVPATQDPDAGWDVPAGASDDTQEASPPLGAAEAGVGSSGAAVRRHSTGSAVRRTDSVGSSVRRSAPAGVPLGFSAAAPVRRHGGIGLPRGTDTQSEEPPVDGSPQADMGEATESDGAGGVAAPAPAAASAGSLGKME